MSSLQPGLFPGPADLLQALRFALVVTLTCGLGFLAGARRVETALFTGWGVGCLVFVAFGCLAPLGQGGLAPVALLLGLLGLVGAISRFGRRGDDGMGWRVLALGAPLLLILLSFRTTAFDDFSFWAPNLIALCRSGHFPLAAQPLAASFMPAYPRGVALAGYATWLLGPDPSPAGIMRLLATGPWWNVLLMLAVAAALAHHLEARLRAKGQESGRPLAWGLAALALLLQSFLNPGFISKMTLTNMGDAATGSGLAMLMALLFEIAGNRSPRVIIELAGTATAVIFIRQDNLALLFIFACGTALGLLLWRTSRPRAMFWLVVASLPALATWLIWTRYCAVQIPGGAHSLLPPRDWHWADYPYTLRAAGRVLLAKGVYTLLALGFGIFFLRGLTGHGPKGAREKLLLTVTVVLVYGNAAFIMFTYLATSFTPVEVRTAVTFWRFLAQTAPAEMVALACMVPLGFIAWLRRPAATLAVSLVTALLPLALLPTPFTFRTDLRFPTPAFLAIGQSLAGILPAHARLLLLDNSDGSGYVAWIIKFGLLELGDANSQVTISLAPQRAPISLAPQRAPGAEAGPTSIPPGEYVLVTQSQWRPAYFAGSNMQPWHAYLFEGSQGGLILLRAWAIPRYGRKY